MTGRGKASMLLGFLALGLSPSFIDWEQSPEYRGQFVLYYGAALALLAFGLWDGG